MLLDISFVGGSIDQETDPETSEWFRRWELPTATSPRYVPLSQPFPLSSSTTTRRNTMTTAPFPTFHIQADDALRLLADLYARRFQGGAPSASDRIRLARWHACELVRNVLYQAQDQADALMQLDHLAQHIEEEHVNQEAEATVWQGVVLDARALVAQVIDAG